MLSFFGKKGQLTKIPLLTLSKKVAFGSSTFGQQFWTAPSCPFLPNFWTGSGCPKVLSFFTADLKSHRHRWHTHQTQASRMLRWLPSLLLLAGSKRDTCLTPPTISSLGSLSMAAPGVDVLLPATALAVALVVLDEVQHDDVSLEVDPVDELPREKLPRSQRKNRDMKTCAWAQLLEDKDLDDSTSITSKHFRVDFRFTLPREGQSLARPVCLSYTLVQPERTRYRQIALPQTA